jgi:hypothetical protein
MSAAELGLAIYLRSWSLVTLENSKPAWKRIQSDAQL